MTARRSARFWIWLFALSFLAIVLVAGAPLILALSASVLAGANGCTLHEGYVNPCVIAGADRGDVLYAMFVMGWFGLVTLPAGALALAVWALAALAVLVFRRRRSGP